MSTERIGIESLESICEAHLHFFILDENENRRFFLIHLIYCFLHFPLHFGSAILRNLQVAFIVLLMCYMEIF